MFEHRITANEIMAYKQELVYEERAFATVEKYVRELQAFAAWLDGCAVSRESVAGWKNALLAQGLAPGTVNGKLSALNGFLRLWAGRTAGPASCAYSAGFSAAAGRN